MLSKSASILSDIYYLTHTALTTQSPHSLVIMLLEENPEPLPAPPVKPVNATHVEYSFGAELQPEPQQNVMPASNPPFTTSRSEIPSHESHDRAGFGLFAGDFTVDTSHGDSAAGGTGLLTGILSADGFGGTYSWAAGPTEDQTLDVPW
jgi:hypothetical protein